MLVAAGWARRAEAARIAHTLTNTGLWVDVEVEALWVAALAVLRPKVALWHLPEIVFVEKLAGFALFAEPSEPMLANNIDLGPIVPVRTLRSKRALPF